MLRRAASAAVLLACTLVALAAPMPAQAAFSRTATATSSVGTAILAPPTDVAAAFNCVANGNITVTWTPSASATTFGTRAPDGGYTIAVTKALVGLFPSTQNFGVGNLGSPGAVIPNASLLSSLKIEVFATYPSSWTSTSVTKTVC